MTARQQAARIRELERELEQVEAYRRGLQQSKLIEGLPLPKKVTDALQAAGEALEARWKRHAVWCKRPNDPDLDAQAAKAGFPCLCESAEKNADIDAALAAIKAARGEG